LKGANKSSGNTLTIIFLLFAYITLVGTLIFASLCYDNKKPEAIPIFYFASTLLGLYMLGSFVMMIIAVIKLLTQSTTNDPDTDKLWYQNPAFMFAALAISVLGHL
jgi:uncharacterized membrane protein